MTSIWKHKTTSIGKDASRRDGYTDLKTGGQMDIDIDTIDIDIDRQVRRQIYR